MPLIKGRKPVRVIRVVDGDTIKVKIDGRVERVRFLYVDTPELNAVNLLEHFKALEAKRYIVSQLKKAKQVYIEQGKLNRDQYGRLLAHVYVDDQHLQKLLLRKGLAKCIFPKKARGIKEEIKVLDEFKRIEEKAKQENRGIWQYEQAGGTMINRVRKIRN
ncbi:thermonuclease family protein [Thermoactinomyces sp. CICC 10522]|uniref:thermonuclease family protein n=1 Tax=Thermoactinomyces sp. CICC 10522 TaxID=2767427 RepID=UPI0018DD2120|nr:thermonuclease family protein [Thermoactinomyces sp. CICC 10522]